MAVNGIGELEFKVMVKVNGQQILFRLDPDRVNGLNEFKHVYQSKGGDLPTIFDRGYMLQVFDSDFGQEVLFDDETRLAHLSIITAIKLFDTNYKDMIFACFHVLISLIRSLKQPSITREEKTLRRLKFHFRNEKRTNLKRFYVMFRPQAMVVRCDIREDSSLYLLMYPKWFIHQFYYGQGDGDCHAVEDGMEDMQQLEDI